MTPGKRLVDPRTVRACDLEAGDVLVRTVAIHIVEGADGQLAYRVYGCPWPAPELSDGLPQGSRIWDSEGLVGPEVFSVIGLAGLGPDD